MSAPSPPIVTDRPDSRNSTLVFYWKRPVSDGDGSGISSYTLNCTSPSTIIRSYDATTSEGIGLISSLNNRTRYSFDIYCTNSNGISSSAVSYFAKQPGNPPTTPVFSNVVSSINGISSIFVYWSPPTNDGGADINRYGIWLFPSDVNQNILSNFGSLSSKTYTYPNVFNRAINIPNINCNYYLTVAAINDAGWSDFETPSRYTFITPGELNPASLPGLMVWLDATSDNSITFSNNSISTISSRSGSLVFNQLPSAKQAPTISSFAATNLNNKQTILFSNNSTAITQASTLSSVKHFFWVGRQGTSTDYNFLIGSADLGYLDWDFGSNRYINTGSNGIRFAPSQIFVNGTAPTTRSWATDIPFAGVGKPFLLNINPRSEPSRFQGLGFDRIYNTFDRRGWNGDFGEMLVFSNTLTPFQISSLNRYLINKWFPSPSNFSPSSINSCMFWIDTSKPNAFTMTGSNVTTIRDFSQHANNLNSLPINQTNYPLFGSSINGLSTVRVASGRGLKQSSTLSGVRHMYWVGRQASNADFPFFLGHDNDAWWHPNFSPPQFINSTWAAADIYNGSGFLANKNTNYLYSNQINTLPLPNCNAVFLLNINPVTGNFTNFQGISYDRNSGSRGWAGDLAEVICFNSTLTVQQQETVEAYLKQKWGITPNPISTPTQLSSLQLWLDASDPYANGTIPAQSTPITTWSDKSGLSRNATANTNNNFFISSCISARPSIRLLNGSYLTGTITPTYTPNTCYVFIVYAGEGGTGQYGRIFAAGNATQEDYGSDNYFGILRFGSGANNVGIYRNNQVVNPSYTFQSSGSIPNGNLITVAFNGTTLAECRVNGISASQGNTNTYAAALSLSAYAIGTNVRTAYGVDGYWEGYVSEVLMYSTLTADQIESVEAYLKQKWFL